jgi:ubiquinone/menaquinone biosynthesis C-methylase UbiE
MRLNLGGRDKPIPGFKTVDLYEGDGVDIRADIGKLDGVKDMSVDEIYASHCLEHFSHTKTAEVLKNWRRVLKKGAKAHIAVPDFDAMVKLYQQFGMNEFIRNMLYGDQGYDLAYHYTVFTLASLASELINAGFEDVKRIPQMPYGLNDCSSKVDSFTEKPTSLNVEATA